MSGFGRMKRVTDPLDHKVKASIVLGCFGSGGSEHNSAHTAAADDDVVSPSLSDLVYGFLVDDSGNIDECPTADDSDSESDSSERYDSVDSVEILINPIAQQVNAADSFKSRLYADVAKAMEVFSCVKSNMPMLRRNVMAFLRNLGYIAALCKTKWDASGGLTAGNYEFIEVIRSGSLNRTTRYFVDLDFAKEFDIARPTSRYENALQSIPRVFVGRSEELKQVLKVMSDAAKRSLKSRGLFLPPWRKHRYMQNKWLGSYKSTTNTNILFSQSQAAAAPVFPQPPPLLQNLTVKCRSVGFDVNGRLLFPATTRTR